MRKRGPPTWPSAGSCATEAIARRGVPSLQSSRRAVRAEEALVSDFYPIGAVVAFAGAALPATASGAWLPCDGSAYDGSNVDYAALFKVIDFIYGKDDAGKFCVPDYRGQFLRGADRQGDIDPDAHLRRRHYDLYPD